MNTDAPTGGMLTLAQAAKLTGLTCQTVRVAIKDRRLPATKVDGAYQITRAAVDAWRASVGTVEADSNG